MKNKTHKTSACNKAISYLDRDFFIEDRDGSRRRISPAEYISLAADSTDMEICYREYLHRSAVQISITSKCNCRCLHCYAGDETGNMAGEFTIGELDRILDECLEAGINIIELTGGEPLVRTDFAEILELIRRKGMRLRAIHTNATLTDRHLMKSLKEAGMNPVFKVSFDGIGIHDRFRETAGAEKAAVKGMELICESGFPMRCNINVNSMTKPYIMDTVRFLAVRFSADVFLIKTSPSPRWEVEACGRDMNYGEYFDLCLEVMEMCLKEKLGVRVEALHMPALSEDGNMADVFEVWEKKDEITCSPFLMDHCSKTREMIYIGHDGRVLPCSGFEGHSKMTGMFAGDDVNILKRPLTDILKCSEYRGMFDVTLGDLYAANPECMKCEWIHICMGGCRLLSLHDADEGKIDNRSQPSCTFFREGFAEKMQRIMSQWVRF